MRPFFASLAGCLTLAVISMAGSAGAAPCYGALGAWQTENRAAATDRTRAGYLGRDRRYSGVDENSLRRQLRHSGCYDRGNSRSFRCQRLAGRLSTARTRTGSYGRAAAGRRRSAQYHENRARGFGNAYTRCGGRARP